MDSVLWRLHACSDKHRGVTGAIILGVAVTRVLTRNYVPDVEYDDKLAGSEIEVKFS